MSLDELLTRVRAAVRRERLLDTATRIIAVPSPTGDAGASMDCLAEILRSDGFAVDRPTGGYDKAPAVAVRFDSGKPGKCIEFDGHMDVVHLPFVPPSVNGNELRGSGSCDMKGGIAAAVEALRAIRDAGLLRAGSVLFLAHDLHEAPWGLGEQLDQLIRDGLHGDAVLIPEALNANLPICGRGSATWRAFVRRSGPPVHEVMRPADQPLVLPAMGELVCRLVEYDRQLASQGETIAGRASTFIGQVHGGEIFNQSTNECMLEGTRRWLAGTDPKNVEADFRELLNATARQHGVTIDLEWRPIRGAFELDPSSAIVSAFQQGHVALSGATLPSGPKLFVDDGNSFSSLANVPTITHGPRGGGQHTVNEWVDIDDLVRVAQLYSITAALYTADSGG